MSAIACFLWWLVLGGLLGLLGSWLLGRIFKRAEPRPVERVVEKPVERIVEKMFDNPEHLSRIKALEGEVALIGGLRSQISQLQAAPPKVVEKIVEKPVDRIVEKVVEKIVDRPVEKVVEKIVDRPVEKVVEKIVDRPVEKIVEKIVDRPIEKIVERVVEKPVDRIVEKIVDRPVEKIVEKTVEKLVDNPAHLARIRALEGEVTLIGGLRSQIAQLQAAPPKVVEKVVEKPIDRLVEKVVERIVDRPVEKIVDRPVEKIVEKVVQDNRGIEERDQKLRDLQLRHDELERRVRGQVQTISERDEELRRLRLPPTIDLNAARTAGFTLKNADDLEIIEGIGPKIAELLRADGITTFMGLADSTPQRIRVILDRAGPSYRMADPETWPEQAELAARNRWRALKSLQDVLIAGVRPDSTQGHEAQIRNLRAQLAEREAEIKRLGEPIKIDLAAAKKAGFDLKGPDDLEVIEGIGPKIAELFHAEGIRTFAALASMTPAQIQPILDRAGPNFRLANPETWPEQSDLAARNRWRALKSLQDVLVAGNR